MKSRIVLKSVQSCFFQCRFSSTFTPKRIVVGLSNSLYGDIALRHAIRMSREGDSIIGLYIAAPVQVQLNGNEAASGDIVDIIRSMKDKQKESVNQVTSRAKKVAEESITKIKGDKPSFTCREIFTQEKRHLSLLKACTELNADILVLGSAGLGQIRRMKESLDDDIARVATIPVFAVQNAPCPVYIVKPNAKEQSQIANALGISSIIHSVS
eukprot:NODE_6187_length_915_cov_26.843434_g5596_i0.p1 GENE.NODE_6187_length_915_cov_26.843434_g5596_i0~~NODE_6187_length_915_cov_26.843434_g5596_i0.p1  ORF type:complete len:229 (-),score=27.33 NODE_6187_length_915_cov_26.843434_g5596_i0:227-862(-)